MRMYDIITKKKHKQELSKEEIRFLITGMLDGSVPDYQISALLMAICLNGMSDEETFELTLAMAKSGEMVDLSKIEGIKVDKHSTGGVGDKTSLVVLPIVASCGVNVAKMSGRGLGFTGGTIDKLESINGFRTSFTGEEFINQVKRHGICIAGQSADIAPADKKLYALRDVTATVDNYSLICASIMSKKLAAGCDRIVLDVKVGSGAFMKTPEEASILAEKMIAVGNMSGRKTVALITNMDIPLGEMIGNALEVEEAVKILKGSQNPRDLRELSVEIAANMLYLADKGDIKECRAAADKALISGNAYRKFIEMIENQNGLLSDEMFIHAPSNDVFAEQDGYIAFMDTEAFGIAASVLGAGRESKDSVIDPKAGIILLKKTGDRVEKGEKIALMLTGDISEKREDRLTAASKIINESIRYSEHKPELQQLVLKRIE